jgi:soluble lytic murein transglycosylase-like protein
MERFAGQYAVDVNVLRHIAVCESGFNPSAVNGLYAGLYQFNVTTWKNGRVLMGEDTNPDLRFNAEESIQTAAYLISQGKRYLWPNCYP